MDLEKAKEIAANLGKRESKVITDNGKKLYLAGTCLVYEDELCDQIYETFKLLGEIFGQTVTWEDFCDDISEIRDSFIEKFEERTNGQIVYGSDQY